MMAVHLVFWSAFDSCASLRSVRRRLHRRTCFKRRPEDKVNCYATTKMLSCQPSILKMGLRGRRPGFPPLVWLLAPGLGQTIGCAQICSWLGVQQTPNAQGCSQEVPSSGVVTCVDGVGIHTSSSSNIRALCESSKWLISLNRRFGSALPRSTSTMSRAAVGRKRLESSVWFAIEAQSMSYHAWGQCVDRLPDAQGVRSPGEHRQVILAKMVKHCLSGSGKLRRSGHQVRCGDGRSNFSMHVY